MTIHFYRMATMVSMACGREVVDGTDFTTVVGEVTCGNCKRSKAYKAAGAEIEQVKDDIATAVEADTSERPTKITSDRVAMAADINGRFTSGDRITVEIDGIPAGVEYAFVDASAVAVYLTTPDGAQQTVDTRVFHLAWQGGWVAPAHVSMSAQPALMDRIRKLAGAEVVDDFQGFRRGHGKVKSTRHSRRYRKGA